MPHGKQAKMLTPKQETAVLTYLQTLRYPIRDRGMFLLSMKAGLRAKEIARLGAGGGREGGDTREPLVRDVGTDGELDGDEDHRCSLYIKRGFFCGARLPRGVSCGDGARSASHPDGAPRGRRPVAYRTCMTATSQCGTSSGA